MANLTESARKEDPATQPLPPQAACEVGGGQGEGNGYKAQGLKRRRRGLRPCNREGAKGG